MVFYENGTYLSNVALLEIGDSNMPWYIFSRKHFQKNLFFSTMESPPNFITHRNEITASYSSTTSLPVYARSPGASPCVDQAHPSLCEGLLVSRPPHRHWAGWQAGHLRIGCAVFYNSLYLSTLPILIIGPISLQTFHLSSHVKGGLCPCFFLLNSRPACFNFQRFWRLNFGKSKS